MYEDAYVYDSVGKRIGKVSKVINSDYIIVRKKGLISDEEFQIPVSCVSHFNSSDDHLSITLTIDQSSLKHGFEIISGGSGGAIPSTHEPELIPTSKETIRYTVVLLVGNRLNSGRKGNRRDFFTWNAILQQNI